ncbi:hypothetical protein GUITHDRAFT_112669 [Guillardia theta CCMP2712]|uniref:Cyclic nucleotide-binding domain-containing protein n=1 Tax=Guillardia theta (strain CCMP2712) TaxID=905079 RepID=L1IY77_GUITC|nr:hypothetical protein GUITHDRAFT_112669 [Guillardia theta CCMP2712]EKX41196.1 hypothetical protein GUITHDRAFT_112669 [Guillardia theta CCMP2712]|eukprot:XP_005828176.1 hypothetical protein GUITHDRAFT_112669 [Guillardia theta CCMP2712]
MFRSGLRSGSSVRRRSNVSFTGVPKNDYFPSKSNVFWRFLGIGDRQGNLKASRLIHPESPFNYTVSLVSSLLLLYTAIVVQVTVSFFWNAPDCWSSPTLPFDMFVDTFFVFQIFLTFFTGVEIQGVYADSLGAVAWNYVTHAFIFDVFTSIPSSYVEYFAVKECGSSGTSVNMNSLLIMRCIKPLRLLKLSRMFRMKKIRLILDSIEEFFQLPGFMMRMFSMLAGISLLVHSCACIYWLIKEMTFSQDEICLFLSHYNLNCYSGLLEKYVLTIYFMNTIFTTVGFGDITPENTAERLFTIIAMYAGVMVFGTMLSEVQSAHMHAFRLQKQCDQVHHDVKDFLRSTNVPKAVSRRVLEWVDLDYMVKMRRNQREAALSLIPPQLRMPIFDHLHKEMLYGIPFLRDLADIHRDQFLLNLFSLAQPITFCSFMPIATVDDACDRLYIITHGSVSVVLPSGSIVSTLNAGDFFGENSFLGETTWRGEHGQEVDFCALTSVVCMYILKEDFMRLLQSFPGHIHEEIEALTQDLKELREEQAASDDPPTSVAIRWFYLFRKAKCHMLHTDGTRDLLIKTVQKLKFASIFGKHDTQRGKFEVIAEKPIPDEEEIVPTWEGRGPQEEAQSHGSSGDILVAIQQLIRAEHDSLRACFDRRISEITTRMDALEEMCFTEDTAKADTASVSGGDIQPVDERYA